VGVGGGVAEGKAKSRSLARLRDDKSVIVQGRAGRGDPFGAAHIVRVRFKRRRACYNFGMEVMVKNRDILGGAPVFRGTRVPVQTLFDYLEGGETLEDFLEGFPTVSRELALAALEEAKQLLLARS